MKKSLALAATGLLALTGCSTTNMSEVLKSLGGDPAIVSGSVTTIYGNGRFVRVGGDRKSQTVSIAPDGTVVITNSGNNNAAAPTQ